MYIREALQIRLFPVVQMLRDCSPTAVGEILNGYAVLRHQIFQNHREIMIYSWIRRVFRQQLINNNARNENISNIWNCENIILDSAANAPSHTSSLVCNIFPTIRSRFELMRLSKNKADVLIKINVSEVFQQLMNENLKFIFLFSTSLVHIYMWMYIYVNIYI